MRTRLESLWERVRTSYWFVPGMMTVGAVLLSGATEALDRVVRLDPLPGARWLYAGGPEGARALLGTIAGSMITVAGVAFSITMVALVLASSQFGPRILRNFMKDAGNQVVLGIFVGTFLYCLLALRTVRGVEDFEFVPHISITVGIVLAIAAVATFIYFIDHVATSIQAPAVVARVGRDLDAALDRHFLEPEKTGGEVRTPTAEGPGGIDTPEEGAGRIVTERSGYLQAVDTGALVSVAAERDAVLWLLRRPGDFLIEGSDLALARPAGVADEELARAVNAALILGDHRTATQDPGFVVAQLVEVAVRALSPGINDPFTAVNCIDRLSAALARVLGRSVREGLLEDEGGRIRVVLRPVTFPELLGSALDPIREYGRGSSVVLVRLLESLAALAVRASRAEDREALRRHAEKALASAEEALTEEPGRALAREGYESVLRALARGGRDSQASPSQHISQKRNS